MTATLDPARGARVIARTPLLYARGADPSIDRPAHVRAGSALVALMGSALGKLAVIQDDACFVAIIDPKTVMSGVTDIIFEGDPGDGARQFDDIRGNKKRKLDLEAAFITKSQEHGSLLVAFGSGSSPLRERVVLVCDPSSEDPIVSIVEAPLLYKSMRADCTFCGSELNVEGATVIGDDVIFFQRGNGAPLPHQPPVDATMRVPLAPLLAYLDGSTETAPPLERIVGWDLGKGNGHRLTFTDGAITHHTNEIAFLACAEDSPDSIQDGPVSAVAIGVLDDETRMCEVGLILDERGAPLLDKAEGLAFDPTDPTRAFVVTDRDDPTAPSELLELRLGDRWRARAYASS